MRRDVMNQRRARYLRDRALARPELGIESVPRTAPEGPTSFHIKAADPNLSRMVAQFIAKRIGRTT